MPPRDRISSSGEIGTTTTMPHAPQLAGRFCRLRPITPADHAPLYEIAVSQEVNLRWRFRGVIPSFEAFVATFRPQDVTAQFTVTTRQSNEAQGLVVAYNTDPRDNHTYVGTFVSEKLAGTGLGVEATYLFANYLFMTWPFRKIYFETIEYNLPSFRTILKDLVRVEGQLGDHLYYGGRYWDMWLLALYRDDALRFGAGREVRQQHRASSLSARQADHGPVVQNSDTTQEGGSST